MSFETIDANQIIKYLFFLLVILIIAMVFFSKREKKHNRKIRQIKQKKGRNYLYPFTKLFLRLPVFKKSFDKNKKRVMMIYPGEIMAINQKVTKDMLISMLVSILVLVIFLLSSNGDIYLIGFGCLTSYVLYSSIINLRYDASSKMLLTQFYTYLSDIRHNYYNTGKKIDDTVYYSINDSPYEIALHAEKIHHILTAVDMQAEMDRYIPISPNRFILSFVAISTSIMEYSDKILANGKSMFITNVGYLKDEVHAELDKIRTNKQLFNMRSLIAIIPVFFVKPIQIWANAAMPEIKEYYTGVYGFTCEIIIFVLSMLSYMLINKLKEISQKNVKEHRLLQRISKWPIISPILTKEVNRNFSKSQKMNDKLKLTGEHMGYKQFILKQVMVAGAVFIAFQVIMATSIWQEKYNILNDYANAFSTSFVADEDYRKEMEETSKVFVDVVRSNPALNNKEALTQEIMNNSNITKPLMAELVSDLVITKVNSVNAVYYKWYYLLISIGIAFIGFKTPLLILEYQVRSIKMNMEDEVGQFQTIVMMLMYVDNMSIRTILEWMERFSYCFKESIQTCINELPADEERALSKLRDSETFQPFKRFVNNLLIVNEQGMEAAFDEIVQERSNAMEDRKKDNEEICKKKATYATIICMIPIAFELLAYMIYPMFEFARSMQAAMNF